MATIDFTVFTGILSIHHGAYSNHKGSLHGCQLPTTRLPWDDYQIYFESVPNLLSSNWPLIKVYVWNYCCGFTSISSYDCFPQDEWWKNSCFHTEAAFDRITYLYHIGYIRTSRVHLGIVEPYSNTTNIQKTEYQRL